MNVEDPPRRQVQNGGRQDSPIRQDDEHIGGHGGEFFRYFVAAQVFRGVDRKTKLQCDLFDGCRARFTRSAGDTVRPRVHGGHVMSGADERAQTIRGRSGRPEKDDARHRVRPRAARD